MQLTDSVSYLRYHAMKKSNSGITNNGAVLLANALKQFILARRLRQGDKLPNHNELSRRFGVGIHRLREGLAILEQQGLIETQRKGGTRIKNPSAEVLSESIRWHLDWMGGYTLEALTWARAALESAVVMEVVRVRTSRDLLVLLDAIEQMEQIPPAASNRVVTSADELFHMELLKATHNPVLQTFGQLILQQFQYKIKENLPVIPDMVKRTIENHRVIVSAIEKRDAGAAREAMYNHLISQFQEFDRNKKMPSGKKTKKRTI